MSGGGAQAPQRAEREAARWQPDRHRRHLATGSARRIDVAEGLGVADRQVHDRRRGLCPAPRVGQDPAEMGLTGEGPRQELGSGIHLMGFQPLHHQVGLAHRITYRSGWHAGPLSVAALPRSAFSPTPFQPLAAAKATRSRIALYAPRRGSPCPCGTYGVARPGRTLDSTALRRRSLIRPPWPGAATRDENRAARPSSALLGAAEPVATRAIFVSG
jgi:hypothetical protein